MKANYQDKEGTSKSMSREDRRTVYKRLKPTIKRIVELEKAIKTGSKEAEDEMTAIISTLNMVEMLAIEDYICGHNLL